MGEFLNVLWTKPFQLCLKIQKICKQLLKNKKNLSSRCIQKMQSKQFDDDNLRKNICNIRDKGLIFLKYKPYR